MEQLALTHLSAHFLPQLVVAVAAMEQHRLDMAAVAQAWVAGEVPALTAQVHG
jgi:hypothetical protein